MKRPLNVIQENMEESKLAVHEGEYIRELIARINYKRFIF